MVSKDFNKRMEDAWEKVTHSSVADSPNIDEFERELLTTRQEVALETMHILRSRFRREKEYWQDVLHKKDHELHALQNKLSGYEQEIRELQHVLDQEKQKIFEHMQSETDLFKQKQQEFDEREKLFRTELSFHQQLAEEANGQLAVEKENFHRVRDQWVLKEKTWEQLIKDREEEVVRIRQEYAEKELALFQKQKKVDSDRESLELEINRLSSLIELERRQHSEITQESQGKIRSLQESLDKAYHQLEMEQKLRDININEFKQYKMQIDELKQGRQHMLEEWDKERAQWKDLWDKERLLWEKKKEEVVEWEKRLRQERERWILAGVPEPEKMLKEFFQPAGTVPPAVSKEFEVTKEEKKPKLYLRPLLAATWNAVLLKKRTRLRRIILAGFVVIITTIGTALLYRETAIYQLQNITPTAFAVSGKNIVVYDQEKSSMFFYSPSHMRQPLKTIDLGRTIALRSCVIAGSLLWSCDPSQQKIYVHRTANPAQIEGIFPAPGQQTTLIAWDGKRVWSYDAAKKEIYMHQMDASLSVQKTFIFPDIDPSALCWWQGYLWVYDQFSHEIARFRLTKERLIKTNSYFLSRKLSLAPVRNVIGMGFINDGLWIAGGTERKIVRYNFNRVKLYNLPF